MYYVTKCPGLGVWEELCWVVPAQGEIMRLHPEVWARAQSQEDRTGLEGPPPSSLRGQEGSVPPLVGLPKGVLTGRQIAFPRDRQIDRQTDIERT